MSCHESQDTDHGDGSWETGWDPGSSVPWTSGWAPWSAEWQQAWDQWALDGSDCVPEQWWCDQGTTSSFLDWVPDVGSSTASTDEPSIVAAFQMLERERADELGRVFSMSASERTSPRERGEERQTLLEAQDAEYRESLRIDQAREEAKRQQQGLRPLPPLPAETSCPVIPDPEMLRAARLAALGVSQHSRSSASCECDSLLDSTTDNRNISMRAHKTVLRRPVVSTPSAESVDMDDVASELSCLQALIDRSSTTTQERRILQALRASVSSTGALNQRDRGNEWVHAEVSLVACRRRCTSGEYASASVWTRRRRPARRRGRGKAWESCVTDTQNRLLCSSGAGARAGGLVPAQFGEINSKAQPFLETAPVEASAQFEGKARSVMQEALVDLLECLAVVPLAREGDQRVLLALQARLDAG